MKSFKVIAAVLVIVGALNWGLVALAHLDLVATLLQALAGLTPRQREVVTLRYLEDLDVNSTATLLRLSVGTVKSTTYDALKRLRVTYPLLLEAEDR